MPLHALPTCLLACLLYLLYPLHDVVFACIALFLALCLSKYLLGAIIHAFWVVNALFYTLAIVVWNLGGCV